MLLREYLEYIATYQVLEAEGVFHLLALCEARLRWPAVLLLDMEWSHIDGVDLILEVKQRVPGLPILGMTDRQADLYNHPRLRRHSVGLIQKPFSPFHLHRSLSATLASHGCVADKKEHRRGDIRSFRLKEHTR
jgi:DNA-binding response OmpR family regulator